MAWASGRRVRRSVKNSTILLVTVGGSCIFRRGTCSLSAVKDGGNGDPLFQPLWTHNGGESHPTLPKYSPTGCLSHPSRGRARAPTQAGLSLCPAVPELAGLGGPIQAVLEAGCV